MLNPRKAEAHLKKVHAAAYHLARSLKSGSRGDTLRAIEKALALMHSVQTLEGAEKEGVEHLLEMTVENLKKPRE